MSNLFKSKFLVGIMLVAVVLVGFAAFTSIASAQQAVVSASDIQYAATVKLGSSGQASLIWQKFLNGYSTANLVADGKFGPLSTAAAKIWQASRNLSADGILGPMSRASAVAQIGSGVVNPIGYTYPAGCSSNSGYSATTGLPCAGTVGNYPAGCTSATGYSATTGLPCTGTYNYPAGCSSATGYSTTTGLPCNGVVVTTLPAGCLVGSIYSSTTGLPCTGTVVSSTGEGSITLDYAAIPASGVAINKGQADQNAVAFTIKAAGSNMNVSRLWLDFDQRLWLFADTATLKDGSTVLGTVALSASTMTEVTAGSKWELQFNGLNVVVPVGTTKTLMLTLGRPTLSNDPTSVTYSPVIGANSIEILASSSVRATDMAGFSNTYNPVVRVLHFLTSGASNGTLTATLSATSPLAQSVTGLSTVAGTYTPVKLLSFDLKATNGPINITALSGTITNTGTCADTGTSSECIASTELRDSAGNVLASVTGANVFAFSSLNINVAQDTTATYSIWVQAKDINTNSVAKGDYLSAVVNSITATSGPNYVNASCTTACTATGANQYFYQYAPTITLGTTTATTSNNGGAISGDYTIAFTVTAPAGQNIYVAKAINTSLSGLTRNVAAKVGAGGGSEAIATPITASTTSGSDGATWPGFIVLAGQSRTFTVYAHIPNGGLGYASIALTDILWNTADVAAGTGATDQTWGLGDYHTASLYLSA